MKNKPATACRRRSYVPPWRPAAGRSGRRATFVAAALAMLVACGCSEPSLGSLDATGDATIHDQPTATPHGGQNHPNANIGDEELARLVIPPDQTKLNLAHSQVTDAGVAQLKELERLTELNLSGTQVTDAGVAQLAAAVNLRHLDLSHTQVTAASVEDIKRLPSLITVKLQGTSIPRQEQLELIQFLAPRFHAENEKLSQEFVPANFQDKARDQGVSQPSD